MLRFNSGSSLAHKDARSFSIFDQTKSFEIYWFDLDSTCSIIKSLIIDIELCWIQYFWDWIDSLFVVMRWWWMTQRRILMKKNKLTSVRFINVTYSWAFVVNLFWWRFAKQTLTPSLPIIVLYYFTCSIFNERFLTLCDRTLIGTLCDSNLNDHLHLSVNVQLSIS